MLKFSNIHRYEPDNWGKNGDIFSTDENLNIVKEKIESGAFVIVEHWHYRGARCPDRFVIEDFEDFVDYLNENAIAGDIIDIFDLTDAWSKREIFLSGKCPDESGEIPEKGAY